MKRGQGLFIVVSGLIVLALFACGKKGPPSLPERSIPLAVTHLKAEWENGAVSLRGSVGVPSQAGQKKETSDVIGCRVYHAYYDLEASPCEGCPIEYQLFKEIKGEVFEREGFYCRVRGIKNKGIHFFEVRLIGRTGALGPSSNRAKLSFDPP